MTYFLDSVCAIVGIFHKYAQWQGESITLNRREMKALLQAEFAEVLENPCDSQTVELTFQLLDVNGDSLVDFNEYLIFIFQIAKACYSYLQPREYLLQEDGSRALQAGEAGGSQRGRRQLEDGERKGDYVRERRGSDRTPLRPTEEYRRGELVRCYLLREPVEEAEERNFQGYDRELRDGDRTSRPSRERRERETERGRLEPKRQEDTATPERRQLRQPDPVVEEGSLRHSRERVRRNDFMDRNEQDLYSVIISSRWEEDGRQRRGRESEHREAEGRLFRYGSKARVDEGNYHAEYNFERSQPSHERRERKDGRSDLERHDEQRSRSFEPRVDGECRDQIRNRSPVDDYEEYRPLPREGERRPQSHEAEHREGERRPQSHEAEHREGEVGRQQRYTFQLRDYVRRANRAEEEEVTNQIRNHSPVDDYEEHRPLPREGERRSQSHEAEHREGERRSQSHEAEHREGEVRRQQRYTFQSRDDVRRENRAEEEEVSRFERRHDEDEWSRPQPREASRRPEVESPEPRERERRRSSSSELENMDRRSRPHESEGREEARRSERLDIVERRREQPNWEEPRARESGSRRPPSREPEPRDPKYGRSQRYEEPRREDQRRQRNYEVRSPERDVARRLQTRELAEREGNGERRRYERESGDGERDRRRPELCYSERREDEKRRPELVDSKVDVRQRLRSRDSVSRPTHDGAKGTGQRQTQPYEANSRDSEAQRTTSHDSNPRQVNQRRTPTHEVDPKDGQLPRRLPSHDSVDQRWTATPSDLREEGQKLTHPHEVDPREGHRDGTVRSLDPDFRDSELSEDHEGDGTQPREVTSLSNQAGNRDFSEDRLRNQRPPESGESHLPRKPGQRQGEQSQTSPPMTEKEQATRGSRVSGPDPRDPQRRWLQPHPTEAQGEEAGAEPTQGKAGSTENERATAQPGERQTAKSQEGRIQGAHPTPAAQPEEASEGSLAGKGGQAQRQQEQQNQAAPLEDPQPEVEEPKVGDDGNGPWAQESQPPLDDEDQQAVIEKTSAVPDESKGSVVCNPLYEYLLAQKNQGPP